MAVLRRCVLAVSIAQAGAFGLSGTWMMGATTLDACRRADTAIMRMQAGGAARPCSEGDNLQRRTLLLRGGALLAAGLGAASPAAAFEVTDVLGDPRGERPSGLGPVGIKLNEDGTVARGFLTPCNSENCVSTGDDVYSKRYLPPWTYNNEGAVDKDAEQAMSELVTVVKNYPGAKIVKQTDSYLLAEFQREGLDGKLGFVDDVEFLVKQDDAADGAGTVEYRSGARKAKKSDHRSRIKALRLELQKKGWKSVGYR